MGNMRQNLSSKLRNEDGNVAGVAIASILGSVVLIALGTSIATSSTVLTGVLERINVNSEISRDLHSRLDNSDSWRGQEHTESVTKSTNNNGAVSRTEHYSKSGGMLLLGYDTAGNPIWGNAGDDEATWKIGF
ncbi:hypothetical protein ACTXJX_11840 [Glutamicibacter ardleyensis]|uniref:hypothetical protein n=1 Tax=Glutamicibacter ardleyensis TaxID=225894 RepID=UPI003FCF5CD1